MGSMIQLAVGRLEIDWGKNSAFGDHSSLFQPTDVKEVPYYYVDDDAEDYLCLTEYGNKIIVIYKEGLSKPLKEVAERIDLLGYTLETCKKEFLYLSSINRFDPNVFTFEHLRKALSSVPVNSLSLDYGEGGEDFGKFFRRQLFPRLGISALVGDPKYVEYEVGEAMENISPYTIIKLLSENSSTLDQPVIWAFKDLEENGWADRDDFVKELSPQDRFLIVTEGSSDALIIKHALLLLKPHLLDFFDFVDMENGYPFTGTGNLKRFVQGLISISIQNNVVVLFDNDSEGIAGYEYCKKLNIPENMRIITLPDLECFKEFKTIGPAGTHLADINRAGAAIECYLDIGGNACVRWKSYSDEAMRCQGALIDKDSYKKTFLSQKQKRDGYNYVKIEIVLQHIINTCIEIRELQVGKGFTLKGV